MNTQELHDALIHGTPIEWHGPHGYHVTVKTLNLTRGQCQTLEFSLHRIDNGNMYHVRNMTEVTH